VLVEVPVELGVIQAMERVPRSEVPELADRVIGATTLHLGVHVLTRDTDLTTSSVPTLW
jgi:predicted nucleic acid-binding protein